MEITNHLYGVYSICRRNARPKRRVNDVRVAHPYNAVIVAEHIGSYIQKIAVRQRCHVIEFVELMIAHAAMYLLVVICCPLPKGMLGVVIITYDS